MENDIQISIREVKGVDIRKMLDYFHNSSYEFLEAMGADKSKLPLKEVWFEVLMNGFLKPMTQRPFYYLYWVLDGEDVGHSNINPIEFGKSAKMHLHFWKKDSRNQGIGKEFLKQCISEYFDKFQLKTLVCEPFTDNVAPNKILPKLGFKLVKTYQTVPGHINFHQWVNRYEIQLEDWNKAL